MKKLKIKESARNNGRKRIVKEDLRDSIYQFLDDLGGYVDYNQKIEDVAEEFGISKEDAEGYVWSHASGVEGNGLLWRVSEDEDDELEGYETVSDFSDYFYTVKEYDAVDNADDIRYELSKRGFDEDFIQEVLEDLAFLQEE